MRQSRWGATPSQRTSQASPKLPCPATPQTSHTDQRKGPGGGLLPAAHGPQHLSFEQHGGPLRDVLCWVSVASMAARVASIWRRS
jgi:hypothetical protein